MKPCPFCGEQIQEIAVKCRYCGEWLDPSRRPETSSLAPAAEVAPPSHRSDMSHGTASGEPQRPGVLPVNPIFDSTIRGVPPFTLDTHSGPVPVATRAPEAARGPASERSDIGAIQVVGQGHRHDHSAPAADQDFDLDLLPSIPATPPPPAPAPAFIPAPAEADEPALSPEPAAFQARPADQFMQSFLGAPEAGDDDLGDDDPFDAGPVAPAPRPPWPWIAAIAACAVAIGLYGARDRLFGPGEPSPEVAAEELEPPAPELKPEPPPEPKLAVAPAKPVPPPLPTDPAFLELLAKAKAAYSDGKLKTTEAALTDLSQQAPEHPEVLLLTAQVQLEQGKMAESRTTVDRCVELDPELADCWLTLGVLRQHGKDDAGAVVAYETYLKLAPTGRYARDANSQLTRLKRSGG